MQIKYATAVKCPKCIDIIETCTNMCLHSAPDEIEPEFKIEIHFDKMTLTSKDSGKLSIDRYEIPDIYVFASTIYEKYSNNLEINSLALIDYGTGLAIYRNNLTDTGRMKQSKVLRLLRNADKLRIENNKPKR